MGGVLIAAPSSGSGKTTITLALLRLLKRKGVGLTPGKAGPDFIDPAFHSVAAGQVCVNFDPWGMRQGTLQMLSNKSQDQSGDRALVVESMMGLFDGAADGSGSGADLADMLGLEIILVVDCSKLSHSVAAIVRGFLTFRPHLKFAGVILNKVGSDRHEAMLRDALSDSGLDILAVMRRDPDLELPERHLGLVQASEHAEIEGFIERAADALAQSLDLDRVLAAAQRCDGFDRIDAVTGVAPLGQKIAVAQDIAFSFTYPHLLDFWRNQGAEICFFSPLTDDVPPKDCDAIFLPGGYPELYADQLSNCINFKQGMLEAAEMGKVIYGECGGYMVLGDAIIDAEGVGHNMLGLLPLVTSFAARKRQLGYRQLVPKDGAPWTQKLNAHEFHYTSIDKGGDARPLFEAVDALGNRLGSVGMQKGNIFGSYMHIIDVAE